MLRELLETAEDLSAYGLVSKTDMACMRVLCEEPPVYKHPSGAAAKLLQLVETKGVEALIP